jgi:alcohol dehydrogenase class IV
MVPTTAGSGSEVSIGAIAFDEETESKFAVLSPMLYPRAAILDPVTLETVPEMLGIESGLDALAHATEAWLSGKASPITDALADSAIRTLAGCIGPAMRDRDSAAMGDQLLAASMAVIAFENAGVGLAHVLGRPLESVFHIPHGRSVAVLLPHVVRLAARGAPDRVAALGRMLGAGGTSWGDSADATVGALETLYDRLGFSGLFDTAAVDPDRLEEMARRAHVIQELGVPDMESVTPDTIIRAGNGASISVGQAAEIYRRCMAP